MGENKAMATAQDSLLRLSWKFARALRAVRMTPAANKASSFADPKDIKAFRKCKLKGGTDKQCFKVGDNGVGCWGDDTSEGSGMSCALPPDDMIEKWGSIAKARHKRVKVMANNNLIICVLKDRLPWKKFVKHGVVIDLNYDSVRAIGKRPPILIDAHWEWV